MSAGQIQLVSYSEENEYLSDDALISFFKIIYKRYTNFSIETVRVEFLNKPTFGNKYTCEVSKYGDLLHRTWVIIDIPEIPVMLNNDGNPNTKLKSAWARNLAYVLIEYVEIVIGSKVICRQYGEYLANLEKLNPTLFNDPMDIYTGNIPELYDFKPVSETRPSYQLRVPLQFWFCNASSQSIPLLCLTYDDVFINVKLADINSCLLFSPTNFTYIKKIYGQPIFNEPILQYNNTGMAWATFDSIDINDYDTSNYKVNNYLLYYRKISDVAFQTTDSEYYDSYKIYNIIADFFNNDTPHNYFIYCLWSKSILIPISNDDLESNNIENTYYYQSIVNNLSLTSTYLLVDYIFLATEERIQFFNNKHEYIIEQIYFTSNKYSNNITNKNNAEVINPCKWVLFLAQLSYLTNNNVCDFFNYTTSFIRDRYTDEFVGIPLIKTAEILLNSQSITGNNEIGFYNKVIPFLKFPRLHSTKNGMALYSFALYPITTQQSGTINLSYFNTIDILTELNAVDLSNTNYILKGYFVTVNVLRFIHGVADTVFYSQY